MDSTKKEKSKFLVVVFATSRLTFKNRTARFVSSYVDRVFVNFQFKGTVA
jgi:hypothetical protein